MSNNMERIPVWMKFHHSGFQMSSSIKFEDKIPTHAIILCNGATMFENVLVLNANFEPLNVCGMPRAIGLLFVNKASMVLNGRGVIRTTNNAFPRPSVIRLHYMVKRPRSQVKLTRREIFRRDNFTCQYCGKKSPDLTVDHIVPRHLGGTQTWANVVTACSYCNHRKGGRTLRDARMILRRKPHEPPSSMNYILSRHLREYSEWEPFIIGW